jgi:predicted  nucleic acid-binding Zn-ribbon protein
MDFQDLKQQWFQEVIDVMTVMVNERFGAPAPPAGTTAVPELVLESTVQQRDSIALLQVQITETACSLDAVQQKLLAMHLEQQVQSGVIRQLTAAATAAKAQQDAVTSSSDLDELKHELQALKDEVAQLKTAAVKPKPATRKSKKDAAAAAAV